MKTVKYITIIVFIVSALVTQAQYNWEEVILPDTVDVKMIAFDTAGIHYIASNNGVYISESGYQWVQSSLTDYVSYIHINENNTLYSGMNTLFRSFDNGATWDSIFYYGSGGIMSICTKGDSNVFIGTWGGGIFRSLDSGQAWTQVIDAYNSEVFNAIVANSQGTLFAGSINFISGGSPGGVYRSEDNGTNWELSNMDYHFVSTIVINSNDEIFVGTSGHYYTGNSEVFKSINNGLSWVSVLSNNTFKSLDINQYDEIAVGCRVNSSPGGIFCSYSDGENWEEITNNLPTNSFNQVSFNPDNYLYTLTHFDDKLFRIETVVSIPNDPDNNQTEEISVFPNPAKDEIQISLSNASTCKITITDISGIQVLEATTIADDDLIKVNIQKLKPGLYIIHCLNKSDGNRVCKFLKY